MPRTAGQTLTHYEILGLLHAGGTRTRFDAEEPDLRWLESPSMTIAAGHSPSFHEARSPGGAESAGLETRSRGFGCRDRVGEPVREAPHR